MLSNDAPFFSFVWFIGVVEGRKDPLNLGRVRVRCIGFHSDDKTLMPTNHLPWAEVVSPVTSAAVSGIGTSPNGLIEGSQVFGFFKDGKLAQLPVVIGSIGGIPQALSNNGGFTDPRGLIPREIDVPDTSSLARSDAGELHPVYLNEVNTRARDIPQAVEQTSDVIASQPVARQTWSQPEPRYGGNTIAGRKSKYPFNHVIESEAGHVVEVDDTPGAERLHIHHRAGTFVEIQANGDTVIKSAGSVYTIIARDNKVVIDGSSSVTIKGDCRMLVGGNMIEEVAGSKHLYVGGDLIENIKGSRATSIMSDQSCAVGRNDQKFVGNEATERVSFDRTSIIGGSDKVVVAGDINMISSGDIFSSAVGDLTILGAVGVAVGSGGVVEVAGAGATTVKGTTVSVEGPATFDSNITAEGDVNVDGEVNADGDIESATAIKRAGVTLTVP